MPRRFVSTTRHQSSGSAAHGRAAACSRRPALVTSRSTGPRSRSTVSTAAFTWSRAVTSAGTATARSAPAATQADSAASRVDRGTAQQPHPHALGRQTERRLPTDPPAGAGDQRDLSGERPVSAPRSTAPVRRPPRPRPPPGRPCLLDGQRPVRRAEPQGVRERRPALAHLLAAVDVEQPQRLQQLAGAVAQRLLHLGGRDAGVDDERDVLGRHREGRDPRCGRPVPASCPSSVEVELHRGRCAPAGRASATTRGCSSPAWPTSLAVDVQRGAAARVPRRVLRRPRRPASRRPARATVRAASTASAQSRRPARAPPARLLRAAGQDDGDAPRLGGQRRVQRRELLVGGAAVDRRPRGRRQRVGAAAGRPRRPRTAPRRGAAADVAAQRGQQPRQQRRAQLRLLVGERVGQPHAPAPVVVRRQHQGVEGRRPRRTGSDGAST